MATNINIHQGYFLIADISGYTAFLTRSELDHAQDILSAIFKNILSNIAPPLQVSNFQGDAILMHISQHQFANPQTFFEIVENIYFSFRQHIENMRHNTTCTCKACRNMVYLDLKFFTHYGAYMLQEMGGRTELAGSDVIIVHRMTKNNVAAEAYNLLTQAAIDALNAQEIAAEMTPHNEIYEHIGEVAMVLHDLKPVWQAEQEKRKVILSKEDAWFEMVVDFPVAPSILWDIMTGKEYKKIWMDMETVNIVAQTGSRQGIDTSYHCAHGDMEFRYTITDWKPFSYNSYISPMGFVGTDIFTQTETGTHLTRRVGPIDESSSQELGQMMEMAYKGSTARLQAVVEQEVAASTFKKGDITNY